MALYSLHLRRLFTLIFVTLPALCLVASNAESSTAKDANNSEVILNQASEHYLSLIFHEYSSNVSKRISAPRFHDLLHDLKLGELVKATKPKPEHNHDHERRSVRDFQETEVTEENRVRSRRRRKQEDDEHLEHGHEKCLDEKDLMNIHDVNEAQGLTSKDFVRICPSLIRQLQEGACVEEEPPTSEDDHPKDNMLHVWGYGVLSITVISLTSLLAIAIIPLIGRSIYTKIMSFLVALAVGTLAGDALLHLIPHAFLSKDVSPKQHRENIFKSCVIMLGIYVFFLVENLLKARLARKRNRPENEHTCEDVTSPEKMTLAQKKKHAAEYQEMVGSRLAGMQRCISCDHAHFPKVSSRPFSEDCKPNLMAACALARMESGKEERASNPSESSQERELLWDASCHGHHCHHQDSLADGGKHSFSDTELTAALQGKTCIHPNIYTNNNFTPSASDSGSHTHHNVNQIRYHDGNQYSYPATSETTTEIIGEGHEPEEDHHHHHHHHSHAIGKGTSIATVAWMVIVGDGFHNFSDGLAVGAAFSASLTQGLTTAIAVLCHELPHELGDFAILLKSGLTFKQALTYNMASAIISYIGLVLGIIIGDIQSAHSWVLVLTAGMFLYISLVDMLPELGNFINEGGGWPVVISQNLGILTGVSIMLVIALYEKH